MMQTVYSIVFMTVHFIMCEGCTDELILGPYIYNGLTDIIKTEYDVSDILTMTVYEDTNAVHGFTVVTDDSTDVIGDNQVVNSDIVITNMKLLTIVGVSGTFRDSIMVQHMKSLEFEYSDGSSTVIGTSTGGGQAFNGNELVKPLQKIAFYTKLFFPSQPPIIVGIQLTFCTAQTGPGVDADPHFIIRMAGSDVPICFNYDVRPGSVIQLVHDVETGLTVNAKLVSKFTPRRKVQTWLGIIAIMDKQNTVLLSPRRVQFNLRSIPWKNTFMNINLHNQTKITIKEKNKIILKISDHVKFAILRHTFGTNGKQPDYLGFFILNQEGLSKSVHGLIGQFRHETVAVKDTLMTASSKHHNATLSFPKSPKKNEIKANRANRFDTYLQTNVSCWFVHNNGQGFLRANFMDYLVPNLRYKNLAPGLMGKNYYVNN